MVKIGAMSMSPVSSARVFAGVQNVYQHDSATLTCPMRFGVYLPDDADNAPALFWLSGLTCTEENFITKAGAQRIASELGMILIAPDTSPRGEAVPDDPQGAYDFGLGAGFYVNATQAPWATHYHMRDYIEKELFELCCSEWPVDPDRIGILGHSMGGHGALTIGLSCPEKFRSISAFAPICSPLACPWGEKALTGYLGTNRDDWKAYDACALIDSGYRNGPLLIDQGDADNFIKEQLKPALLKAACEKAGIDLTLRVQPGFDHSYFFIASFIEDHIRWHAGRLG